MEELIKELNRRENLHTMFNILNRQSKYYLSIGNIDEFDIIMDKLDLLISLY